MTLTCPYCGAAARHRSSSAHVYQGRDYGPIWECPHCDAYCGCHPDGSPLGTLANKPLRNARRAFKDLFNPLWQDIDAAYLGIPVQRSRVRHLMRTRAYEWLAAHMQIDLQLCHGAMFDLAQCARAIAIIQELKPSAAAIRAWAKERKPKKSKAVKA